MIQHSSHDTAILSRPRVRRLSLWLALGSRVGFKTPSPSIPYSSLCSSAFAICPFRKTRTLHRLQLFRRVRRYGMRRVRPTGTGERSHWADPSWTGFTESGVGSSSLAQMLTKRSCSQCRPDMAILNGDQRRWLKGEHHRVQGVRLPPFQGHGSGDCVIISATCSLLSAISTHRAGKDKEEPPLL